MNNKQIQTADINAVQFEDDPEAVGKWEIIGEYATKESFLTKSEPEKNNYGERFKEIYFLPNGQRYWIYSWTKGFIINHGKLNPYTIEDINGEKYMFVDWQSYRENITVLVLRQSDGKKYTLAEISRPDDVDKPFIDDKKIVGKWQAFAHISNKNEYFDTDHPNPEAFQQNIEFQENGRCARNGNIMTYATWTKGYLLMKSGPDDGSQYTAEKYEIKTIDGKEFLFIEWKSGDYIWGGWDPTYSVFARA